jgi:hypothetical protein
MCGQSLSRTVSGVHDQVGCGYGTCVITCQEQYGSCDILGLKNASQTLYPEHFRLKLLPGGIRSLQFSRVERLFDR